MNPDNFITIQGWMRTELNLKGNELLVYAIIYGFSQTEDQKFTGGLQYLADWCGATKQGVLKNLKSLIDKGFITKDESVVNGIKYCEYSFTPLNLVQYPMKLSSPNNIDNNKKTILSKDNIVENFDFGIKKPKKVSLYDKCVSLINDFTDDSILVELLIKSLQMFLENSKESGKPLYTNQFKGKLNALNNLSSDNYVQRKIVQQTLENGWNNFYELKTNTKKNIKNFAEDVEHLKAGLNERADKKGGYNGKEY